MDSKRWRGYCARVNMECRACRQAAYRQQQAIARYAPVEIVALLAALKAEQYTWVDVG